MRPRRSSETHLPAALCLALVLVLAGCAHPPGAEESGPEGYVAAPDGVRIHYRVVGDGAPALLFVHCWSCEASYWNAQVPYFSGRHQVVTLDLAGHGLSGQGRKRYTMAAFAGDVVAVADRLDLRDVVLIGHSMGGPVSVEAARRLAGRVRAVVAVDSFYTPFAWPDEAHIEEALAPFRSDFRRSTQGLVRSMLPATTDPKLADRIANDMSAAPPSVATSAFHEILLWGVHDRARALSSLEVPLIHINAHPAPAPASVVGSLELVAGAGHFIPQVAPGRFNATLERVLGDLEARGP